MQPNFTTSIRVNATPEEASAAISNPRAWWSENIEGRTDQVGAIFDYRFRDVHRCTIEVAELVPGKRIVWHVRENYFSFTQDASEWKGTDLVFEIAKRGDQTEITFTHKGLVPEYECYGACSEGWRTYVDGSLKDLITTGKGQPNAGEAMTASEHALGR
jgi:activator of Hsp90 ATPase-like protein